jgi:hypothetical protein
MDTPTGKQSGLGPGEDKRVSQKMVRVLAVTPDTAILSTAS